ncbi:AzlD domain-containing protein [Fulvimarina sp. 2208YS6-2-32]|uniref:AzlD domain-containing protein n=1 Tax=Fulvimarina uroteuthidis TaxID=3098149 RepID=A0ABU5I4L2_9HYPH|nr:AzlD domain-containing protein [Fulvimarina sp. 2208YS6-2-32]MDY8109719.1 AzlD domain-containing protein [Fulvimarina sp. 2208YS6-2-32]
MSEDLSYYGIAADWWPFAFILLAGWLPTDIWRTLGVLSSGKLDEHSPVAAISRTVATALVSAVIGQLVFYPTGSLADIPAIVRIGAMAAGFGVYLGVGRRILAGIAAAELVIFGWIAFSLWA